MDKRKIDFWTNADNWARLIAYLLIIYLIMKAFNLI